MNCKPFNKILIANRGEIACRIIKTAKKLGINTVAVYSDADKNALHVALADEAIYIGPAPSRESYLVKEKIIEAALSTGAEAIHPGYGFLSENADFCNDCKKHNIVFIGPPVEAIEAMGSKSAAKRIMEAAKVPLVPGYHGADQSPELLKKAADDMGYPVLLKAVAGGGGKGMRQVWKAEEFSEALAAAKREAMNGFGNDDMLVEKYLTQPRHVEIQVFCDKHGNAVYLFERDCSVQRRHQKIIEEAPAPGMTAQLRQAMGDAAIRAAQAINYEGAGTVEFLLDVDQSFYFMEMNTRLQVEHPVTEMITRQDLVAWQLAVAAGEALPLAQEALAIKGHAFEARIYAEDPDNDFLPVTGTLTFLQTPNTSDVVRVDTGVLQGDEVSIYYDPMIAKLIVWGEDRQKALQQLTAALRNYRISGMKTNIEFLYNLAACKPFQNAELDTGFIDKHQNLLNSTQSLATDKVVAMAALFVTLQQQQEIEQFRSNNNDSSSPWFSATGWRVNETYEQTLNFEYLGELHSTVVSYPNGKKCIRIAGNSLDIDGFIDGDHYQAIIEGYQLKASVAKQDNHYTFFTQYGVHHVSQILPDLGDHEDSAADGGLLAPMNGTVVTLLAKAGDTVKKDAPLMVMEAMKMEHTIRAPTDGAVVEFYFQVGDLISGGAELLQFEHAQ